MKRVLVTGATGFVGANLVRTLIQKNYQVDILKRKDSPIWRIKDIISKLNPHDVDLLEKKTLSKLLQKIKPQIIFHLANLGSYAGIDPSIEDSLKINTIGTINLIESADAIDYECFINTGSSSEYGNKHHPMQETDLCEPITNYAISKLTTSLYAKSYANKTKKPLVTLRLFSPFGSYDHPRRLIAETILKLIKQQEIICYNPTATRDYIFIDDVICAYLKCLEKPEKLTGEILNVGSGQQTSVYDMIQLLKIETGSKSPIKYADTQNGNLLIWQADIKKAYESLNWRPEKNLIQGIKETITWFRKYSYLYD